jgi:hypothetical protein
MTTATPNNRIAQIQAAHPWLLEREVVGLLTACYAAACHLHRDADAIHQQMEDATEKICKDSRKNIEELLKTLPEKLLKG